MTVLGETEAWPTRPMRGTAPADMRREPCTINEIIDRPMIEFQRRNGRSPTHLLLGWNARCQLSSELSTVPMYAMPPDLTGKRKREYRGMTLIFMDQNGVELLNDLL